MNLTVLLFDDFETLDVFGPVEIFGRLKGRYQVKFCSLEGGLIANNHGVSIPTHSIDAVMNEIEIFLIPGGYGTRQEVFNERLIEKIQEVASRCRYVLTVCTGTSLLAKTGLLDGLKATSNKKAFDWVVSMGEKVNWQRKARWVVDGKYYTSSGVTAGMDMALSFVAEKDGIEVAEQVARDIEYSWVRDSSDDPFAELYMKEPK